MCISDMPIHKKGRKEFPSFKSYMLARINELLCKRPGSGAGENVQGVLDTIERIYESEIKEYTKTTPYDSFFNKLGKSE